MSKKLNPQQLKFINFFMLTGNGTQSAIKAGYSKKGADSYATQLLSNPKVRAEIDRRCKLSDAYYARLRKKLIESTANKAFSDLKDFGRFHAHGYELHDNIEDLDTSAIQEVKILQRGDWPEITFKLADKAKYHDMLYKHLGAYNDKLTVQGPAPIVVNSFEGQKMLEMRMTDEIEADYDEEVEDATE